MADSIVRGELQEYASVCTKELLDVVASVRGQLTKLQRATLSALIVIDVHARDVVNELALAEVSDENDFEWTSQLRYTWDDEDVRPPPHQIPSSQESTSTMRFAESLSKASSHRGMGARLYAGECAHNQCTDCVWLRVSGQQWAAGHHTPHRPLLPHSHGRSTPQPWRCS